MWETEQHINKKEQKTYLHNWSLLNDEWKGDLLRAASGRKLVLSTMRTRRGGRRSHSAALLPPLPCCLVLSCLPYIPTTSLMPFAVCTPTSKSFLCSYSSHPFIASRSVLGFLSLVFRVDLRAVLNPMHMLARKWHPRMEWRASGQNCREILVQFF